jgi:dynein heavy chain
MDISEVSAESCQAGSAGTAGQRVEGGSVVEALAEAIAEVEHCSLQLRLQEAAAQQCLVVEGIETKLREAVAQVEEMKQEIDADLSQVVPRMEQALEALDRLEYEDLSRTRALTQPPAAVALVLAAVCEVLGTRMDKQKKDAAASTSQPAASASASSSSQAQEPLEKSWSHEACMQYWPAAQKLLSVGLVIQQIHCFDKDRASDAIIERLRPLQAHPDLDPDGPLRDSPTGAALALWVRALVAYHEAARAVAPKKDRFQELTKLLETQEASLAEELQRLQELQAAAEESSSSWAARSVLLRQPFGAATVGLPDKGRNALATRGQAVREALQLSAELP